MYRLMTGKFLKIGGRSVLALAALAVLGILIWQGVTASGNPDPTASHLDHNAAILDTGILVFREGLECILVIAAITASLMGSNSGYRKPISIGVGLGLLATVATWFVAIAVLSQIDAEHALHRRRRSPRYWVHRALSARRHRYRIG